jgi:hypothetical protein
MNIYNFTESIVIVNSKVLLYSSNEYDKIISQLNEENYKIIFKNEKTIIYHGINNNVGNKNIFLFYLNKLEIPNSSYSNF